MASMALRQKQTSSAGNTSYSKEVPAESEYSSKSYHASMEMELPDVLTEQQIKERIHGTFELARNTVETEVGTQSPRQLPANNPPPSQAQKPETERLLQIWRQEDLLRLPWA